jgi:hypothetical protein
MKDCRLAVGRKISLTFTIRLLDRTPVEERTGGLNCNCMRKQPVNSVTNQNPKSLQSQYLMMTIVTLLKAIH